MDDSQDRGGQGPPGPGGTRPLGIPKALPATMPVGLKPAEPSPSPPSKPEKTLPPAQVAAASSAENAGEDAPDPLIETVIAGRYILKEKLGAGGMGAVYRGEHLGLRKKVAVKLLHGELAQNPELVTRFEREAMAAAHLQHPNIAVATDFGRTQDGGFFLVMEYVEGRSLRKIGRDEWPLGTARVVMLLKQVAAALTKAHAIGVVHRDLKPENVVVATTQEGERCKVIDFGIAKVRVKALGTAAQTLTQNGMIFGTPEYMSPEQALGEAVDGRSDQYSLGVMGYELLSGFRPFTATEPVDLLRMHAAVVAPPLSSVWSGATPAVDAVFARMLAKKPEDRFATPTEAIEALEQALQQATAPAPPPVPQAPQSSSAVVAATASTPPAQPPAPVVVPAPDPRLSAVSVQPAPQSAVPPTNLHPPVPEATHGSLAWAWRMGAVLAVLSTVITIGVVRWNKAQRRNTDPTTASRASVTDRLVAYQQDPAIVAAMGQAFRGEVAPAVSALQARKQRNPNDGMLSYFLGCVCWSGRRTAEALTAFADAVRLEPELAEDPTLAQAVAGAIEDPATRSDALHLLAGGRLGRSRAVGDALSYSAMYGSTEDGRRAAANAANAMPAFLRTTDRLRVQVRVAEDCSLLRSSVEAMEQSPSRDARNEAARLRAGDCSFSRVPSCGQCFPPRDAGSTAQGQRVRATN